MNAALETLPPAPTLDADKLALLARLTHGLAPADLYWIAAYSAAAAARAPGQAALAAVGKPAPETGERLTVVYGSQTGNSRRVAERLAARAEAAGLPVRLLRAGAYPLRELAQERLLGVVISSQGDGDPPDDAIGFVEFIAGRRAPKLPQLKFAVLGLGDSSYPKYCAVSQALDARLAELGGQRFAELGEADVDFEAAAAGWSERSLAAAREAIAVPASPRPATALHAVRTAACSREHPFAAAVLENQRIVSRDSERDVRHVELSLEGSGLHYEAGDAVGVWPRNPPALVEQWLATLQLDGAADVEHDGKHLPLARWLAEEREITRLTRPLVAAQAAASNHAGLRRLLEPEQRADFAALLESHQPIDLLREFPAAWDATELVAALRPLTPRLYSIASSPKAVGPDEVHLTVAVVEYLAHGSVHCGAASRFLADAADGAAVPVFIEPNERFRLPVDGSRDVIMIGPGTGVAPFRAFVQEREATAASGRNWLFFGNRHFAHDFLYQLEWQDALRRGSLSRLDLAFSRDGVARSESPHKDLRGVARHPHKVYVQQRLRENGRELYAWLREGAHLYVCGDSAHMARDVHEALLEIAATHGGLSADDARAWLADLLQQGRYARDVY
ncbi:MAG: assimilatory sulfite reductase (NADPH) flavoprotein subunit [Rhodanobacter sp.]